ncbi:MAG: biotin carboxylase N-terminal domain-containing protein [Candidatus Thermoplasmatota archaeon]|nr:biotin carboxylase N-terminal domain-containing protein [Candidatus Thermoplasmatota archaeon]MEC8171103.1 biotin carboxylase N-terminal domain-containing protein [Candidatus Thermoplasmatota archaeon]MEC9136226.1 biotin carboxylase N-terminal domain-containing protein [Candidatus Thermoplasmatota archaeon]
MFRRVLVANRGEIALRVVRSLRELGIESVVIHGREDRMSLPVRLADEGFYIPSEDPLASYLDIEAIVSAAKEVGADAVHPGYGFLSENATFAQLLSDEGITFIGPSPESLRLLGDKIAAREAMSKAGIPVAKGTEEPITDNDEALEIASKIGFPLMIKAASGGGGIGMQIVHEESEFESALRLCQGRANSAFGDSRVFIEEYVDSAEHIEFQVLADGKRAIHFGERFCSIQRRHQKIIEEGPWISEEERQDIGSKVVAGAEAIGYRGLATFEFLRNKNGQFYFMEVNPRVQVEHTVTEMLTGVDLVSLGIIVSSGANLPLEQNDVQIQGHAIQARINAENPFTLEPSPGKIWECHWPGGPGIRVDTHGFSGYEMPEAFDSLLAKIICWAPDREKAIARLDSALEETILLGVDSLIPLHRAILIDTDFMERKITTDYLETHTDLLIGGG